MDDELDLSGRFRLTPETPIQTVPKDFAGTVFTGRSPPTSHPALRSQGNAHERRSFLNAASEAFRKHHVRIPATQIRSETVWKTQLRAGRNALASNVLAQISAGKPLTHHSYRLLLIVEEHDGHYTPVFTHFHHATILLDKGAEPTKPGEELDEENDTDKEVFLDDFPLFGGEPDAVITRHS